VLRRTRATIRRAILLVTAVVLTAGPASAERIKDIIDIRGVRGNPLLGYGLVVGLAGTGDSSEASQRTIASILRKFNDIVLEPKALASKSIASVIVTAELGPFSSTGSKIDVTVSTIGDAKSLQGGTLLPTPLMALDKEQYAVASGNVMLSGFSAVGKAGSVQKGHITVGRIPAGAYVEKEELATFVEHGEITLLLKNADFATADRIANAVNTLFPATAEARSAGAVRVRVPKDVTRPKVTGFIRKIGALQVQVDMPAVVVINERTGTIIVGQRVGISPVAISQGSLTVVIKEKTDVSQPGPFAYRGQTEKTQSTEMTTVEAASQLRVIPKLVTVAELARSLNEMGLTPRDLIAIFQNLKTAGALQAELKVN